MELSDIAEKIASNARLTPSELDFWKQSMRETQLRNNFLAGNIDSRNQLSVESSFQLIFKERFESNKATVSFDVPAGFDHLLIMGSGSITTANGGNVWAQFNGDTGNNYQWQFVKADNATISGAQDTSDPYVVLGVFGTTGAGAGVNGSFFAKIIHYGSDIWKKNVISEIYIAEFNDLYFAGSTWANTTPIRNIEIFATDNTLAKGTASIAAGSIITVYAVK